MAQTVPFSAFVLPRRPRPYTRPLGDKLHDIAIRSPRDIRALDRICDLILAKLDAELDRQAG